MAKRYVTDFASFARFLIDLLHSDRDAVVVIDGDTGEGKSTAAGHILEEVGLLSGLGFNPVKQLVYDRSEFNSAVDDFPRFSVISADEAVGLFFSRDYQDQEQIALLKKLDRIRYRNLVLLLVIPSLMELDKHIRERRVRYWVHVDSRRGKGSSGSAHCFIFQKDKNPFNPDPWNIKLNRHLFRQGRIADSPNYVGEVNFRDLPASWHELLVEIKDLKRKRVELIEWGDAQADKSRRRGRRV